VKEEEEREGRPKKRSPERGRERGEERRERDESSSINQVFSSFPHHSHGPPSLSSLYTILILNLFSTLSAQTSKRAQIE
jgi:hypothetical protein